MLAWFDVTAVKALADAVVEDFVHRCSVHELAKETNTSMQRFQGAKDSMLDRVGKFSLVQPMNFYKRASLANTIKWKLMDAGYDKKIVDALVLDVIKSVVSAKK